jgi:hypothetical protein
MVGRHVGRRDEGFEDVGEGRLYAQRVLRLLSILQLEVK